MQSYIALLSSCYISQYQWPSRFCHVANGVWTSPKSPSSWSQVIPCNRACHCTAPLAVWATRQADKINKKNKHFFSCLRPNKDKSTQYVCMYACQLTALWVFIAQEKLPSEACNTLYQYLFPHPTTTASFLLLLYSAAVPDRMLHSAEVLPHL